MAQATLKVTGMTCGHCVHAVTHALQHIEGVQDVRVDLEQGRAWVDYDDGRAGLPSMITAVEEEGYGAEVAA